MEARLIELADWLEQQCAGPEPATDILKRAPEMSLVEAYRIQRILTEGFRLTRWAADCGVWCRTREEAQRA